MILRRIVRDQTFPRLDSQFAGQQISTSICYQSLRLPAINAAYRMANG